MLADILLFNGDPASALPEYNAVLLKTDQKLVTIPEKRFLGNY
jgi:hypothetical protein